MTLKTYGIDNLVDWKAQINVGKAKVIVHFTGGAITRYGVTPAEYSTADAMLQHVIERSDYYKSGRIKLLRMVEVADDAATKTRKAREAQSAKRKNAEEATNNEGKPDKANSEGTENHEQPTADECTEQTDHDEGKGQSDIEATDKSDRTELTEVEVSCLQDAQDYLKEKFNVPSTGIRSYEKAQTAGASHGVVFVGGKF